MAGLCWLLSIIFMLWATAEDRPAVAAGAVLLSFWAMERTLAHAGVG
jgi:hypothetical protein